MTDTPSFEPRELKDWSGWYVLAQWPNGREQQINGFKSEAEARKWISEEATAWLAPAPRASAKPPKRPRDPNQLAKLIADIATGDTDDVQAPESQMAERGRAGGMKGGAARAAALTPEQRQEIARKGAAKRWGG